MKHTNKEILGKGIKYLAFALPLTLIGPSVLFTAFNNQHHPFYIPVLIGGIVAIIAAILLMFKGIITVVKAVFD
ncbi:DUF6095 family protein [Salegentibacter salegens]|uniref:Uncharacterized protein n=1 Tax=Salegentibacter salegens TaxID=143223 RepID=A0A1M7KJ38_9FLAO|nr:DUF6095 family protein [Salegentibacter salegens]PRX49695.1 hypothetical protein LY58_01104 [Salegentibacter salegens]SHM65394.1 hypothetical protein SAMN05878281_1455 [Salegentibacter salegens]